MGIRDETPCLLNGMPLQMVSDHHHPPSVPPHSNTGIVSCILIHPIVLYTKMLSVNVGQLCRHCIIIFTAAILKAARSRSGPVATRFTSSCIKEHKKVKDLERKMSIEDQKLKKKFDEVSSADRKVRMCPMCSLADVCLLTFYRRSSLSPRNMISRSAKHQIDELKLRMRSSLSWGR